MTPLGLRALAWSQVPAPDAAIQQQAAAHCDEGHGDDELQTRIERTEPRDVETADAQSGREPRGLQPFLLRAARGHARTAHGVVLLRCEDGRQLRLQWEVLSAVCETLLRAGDLKAE